MSLDSAPNDKSLCPTPDLDSRGAVPFDRIVVTGGAGQLGQRLCALLGPAAIPLDAEQLDITNARQVRAQLQRIRPQVLINTAAYTAVDRAESDAERCFAVNRDAVQTLVDVSVDLGCPLVQISTDYVFGGATWQDRPYRETDPPAPKGVYARSKAESEEVTHRHPEHLIIRSCGIFGPHGPRAKGNFVNTMLRLGRERTSLGVVNDQVCCPTYVVELAQAVVYLIATQRRGTFHVVNQQAISWCEFAREIFRLAQIECEVVPITTEQYGAAAPRPRQSALDVSKYLAIAGPALSTCRHALARYLHQHALAGGAVRSGYAR